MVSPIGEYDFKFEEVEGEIKTWTAQKAYQRNVMLSADNTINDKVYGDISEEEELYNYKKKIARELMQLQADAFYKNQQKML